MCLILFAYKAHPRFPLIVAANRDESYARPTAHAAFWSDFPHIYGGRDLEHGGTWLGISRSGGIAALTNFRDGNSARNSPHSRGELATGYLCGSERPADYLARVQREAHAYNGFNLIAGNLDELYHFSNRAAPVTAIAPGVHGLSNHLLDTPWPKVEHGKAILQELLDREPRTLADGLFGALAERVIAPDGQLPATGVGLQRERVLSPAFIVSQTYGTRSSTVILIDNNGQVVFTERSFGKLGTPGRTITGRFALETTPTRAEA